MNRYPIARDIFDRVWRTFVVVLGGLATADGVGWADWADLSNWKTWGVAAFSAAFTLLLSLLATQVGKLRGQATSASFDPKVKLAPVAASDRPVSG